MSDLERIERLKSQIQLTQSVAQNQELSDEQLQAIRKIWREQDELINENTDHFTMQEVLMDLEVIDKTGSALGHYIKTVKAGSNVFSLSEYADKLKEEYVDGDAFDWEKMAAVAAPIINRAPGFPVMLGTFKPNAPFVMPERKKKNVRSKDEIAEKQKPENMEMIETNNDSIEVKVNFLIKALKKSYEKNGNQSLPLYDFILHPTDFTITIENIFYLSFVIRDGLAAIEAVGDDLMIRPMERGPDTGKQGKKQMMFSITLDKWKELITDRNITKPAINWYSKR